MQIIAEMRDSVIDVHADAGDPDRAAVAVVAGVVDVAEAEGEEQPTHDVPVVVTLGDIFAAVVEAAIA